MSGEAYEMYEVQGTQYKRVDHSSFHRQKQMKNGGQSAARFSRIRQNQIGEFVKKVVDNCNEMWIKDSVVQIKGLIIAGIADLKDQVKQQLHPKLKSMIRATLNCTQQSLTIQYVLGQTQEIVGRCDVATETKLLQQLLERIEYLDPLVVYGEEMLEKYIQQQLIKQVYMHKENESKTIPNLLGNTTTRNIEIIKLEVQNEIGMNFVHNYGGIVGILWFDISRIENETDEETETQNTIKNEAF